MNAGPLRRIGYSLAGLGVADAVALLIELARDPDTLSQLHFYPPDNQTGQILVIYAFVPAFSVLGWLLTGVPMALLLSTQDIVELPWLILLPGGAMLGPVSLFLALMLLSRGQDVYETLRGARTAFIVAAFISGTAFSVHCLLMRWYELSPAPERRKDEGAAAL
jgi:hypothetical protein